MCTATVHIQQEMHAPYLASPSKQICTYMSTVIGTETELMFINLILY